MKFWVTISVGEFEPVVSERRQSKQRHESKVISLFWKIWTNRKLMQIQKPSYFSGEWFGTTSTFSIENLMEESEKIVLEKWKEWKTNLFKTVGEFFDEPIHHDSDTREKTKSIHMEYSCIIRRNSIDTWMKYLININLEKIEWQLLGTSILFALFGVSSVWEFQNDMLQQIYFREKLSFLIPEKRGWWKKLIPKRKKKNAITYFYIQNF